MELLDELRNLLVMAAIDGSLTEREINFLSERCHAWSIADQDLAEAIHYATSPEAKLTLPQTPERQVKMLEDLIRMMAADGQLADVEKKLFACAAVRMGLSDLELQQIIDSVVPAS